MITFWRLTIIIMGLISQAELHSMAESYSKALNYFAHLKTFHTDFRELDTPQVRALLTPDISKVTLKVIVEIIKKNKPKFAVTHFNPYSIAYPDEHEILLAKIALMTHNKELLEKIIYGGNPYYTHAHLIKSAFFLVLYEAKAQDTMVAQDFLTLLYHANKAVINSVDEIGNTPLAIAAAIQKSPELTQTLLDFKPDVNKLRGYKTVLDMVNEALEREKVLKTQQNLQSIKDKLLRAGAETASLKQVSFQFSKPQT